MTDTKTLTLTEFLTARLDEDWAAASEMGGHFHWYPGVGDVGVVIDQARLKRDVKAKREIVQNFEPEHGVAHALELAMWVGVLKEIAAVYADHPDYNPDWRP